MKRLVLILFVCLSFTGITYGQAFDSLNVRFVGNWPFGPSYAVTHDSARSLVFLGSGGGVYILDASDPEEPVKISDEIRTRGVVNGLFYHTTSQNLYIATGIEGFEVWNISNPDLPKNLTRYDTPGTVTDVYVSTPYAYVADNSGLLVIDISDPSQPQEVGQGSTTGYTVYVSGSYAYVTDAGLRVIDISTPSDPQEIAYLRKGRAADDIYLSGSHAYIANSDFGLWIVDISNPSNPKEVSVSYVADPLAVQVSASYAYVTTWEGALYVIDISTPSNPQRVAGASLMSSGWDVCVSGSHAYVACWGFSIFDVSAPLNPQEVSSLTPPLQARSVCVSGNYAYVTDTYLGLTVVDISDPFNPRWMGNCDTPMWAEDVCVSGNYAYVADKGSVYLDLPARLRIIDVSDPSTPHEVGLCELPYTLFSTDPMSLYVSGSYAYVVSGWKGGLRIIDVSEPSNPQVIGYYDKLGGAQDVCVSGNYAYIADGDAGLRVIDISDPSNPQEIGYLKTDSGCWSVYISSSYAYLGSYGLRVIDISNPSVPQEVGYFYTGTWSVDVQVSSPYAYFSHSLSFKMVNVSDPSHPQEAGFYETPSWTWGIFVVDPYIYVVTSDAGLQIYENLLWEGVEESTIPTSPPIRISASLNRLSYDVPDGTQLTLYSADGRKVLEETIEGKGIWEAQTDLPQGVYFALVSIEGYSAHTKVVVLR